MSQGKKYTETKRTRETNIPRWYTVYYPHFSGKYLDISNAKNAKKVQMECNLNFSPVQWLDSGRSGLMDEAIEVWYIYSIILEVFYPKLDAEAEFWIDPWPMAAICFFVLLMVWHLTLAEAILHRYGHQQGPPFSNCRVAVYSFLTTPPLAYNLWQKRYGGKII